MRKAILLLSILPLCACAAVWGKAHKVEFQSPAGITINYDPVLTNMGEIQHVAQNHCAQYGKNAMPDDQAESPWELRTISFRCE